MVTILPPGRIQNPAYRYAWLSPLSPNVLYTRTLFDPHLPPVLPPEPAACCCLCKVEISGSDTTMREISNQTRQVRKG